MPTRLVFAFALVAVFPPLPAQPYTAKVIQGAIKAGYRPGGNCKP